MTGSRPSLAATAATASAQRVRGQPAGVRHHLDPPVQALAHDLFHLGDEGPRVPGAVVPRPGSWPAPAWSARPASRRSARRWARPRPSPGRRPAGRRRTRCSWRCESAAVMVASSRTASRSPALTWSPGWARTSRSVPARGAVIRCSIFMASTIMSNWPAATVSPAADVHREHRAGHRGDQAAGHLLAVPGLGEAGHGGERQVAVRALDPHPVPGREHVQPVPVPALLEVDPAVAGVVDGHGFPGSRFAVRIRAGPGDRDVEPAITLPGVTDHHGVRAVPELGPLRRHHRVAPATGQRGQHRRRGPPGRLGGERRPGRRGAQFAR